MTKGRLIAVIAVTAALGAAAVVLAVAVASHKAGAVAAGPPPGPYRGSEPPAGIHAPDFTLRDSLAGVVSMRSLRGKVVLVTFLDTACKEKCPVIAGEIAAALPRLSKSERAEVVPLAITVNPHIDTRANVARFLAVQHLTGKLRYLTGTIGELTPVWRAFHILSAFETKNADFHSADVRVFDRRGVWVSTLHTPVDLTPVNLAHDLATALRRS